MKYLTCLLAWTMIVLALTTSQSLAQSTYEPYTFTTLAGQADGDGSADGTGSAARFWNPSGVTMDSAGNVYVADRGNDTIRKVTAAGVVTTLAGLPRSQGSTDGTGSTARFSWPQGVAVDSAGNIYVADTENSTIRKVTPTKVVTTVAGSTRNNGDTDGIGSAARFSLPCGVAVDGLGNVYVADTFNHTIRKVTLIGTNWVVTTLAGNASIKDRYGFPAGGYANGTGSGARFNLPCGVAVDNAGNVYVADTWNHTIRKVTPAGTVTTLAGMAGIPDNVDETGSAARFYAPTSLSVDSAGNVYVADTRNYTIREVTPAGVVTTLAGLGSSGSEDGTRSAARFSSPAGVTVDSAGNVYVADNNMVRKVTPTGVVTTLAGVAASRGTAEGTGSDARFGGVDGGPAGVAVDSASNVYVGDSGNNTLRKVTPAGVVTTMAGRAGTQGSADGSGSAARFWSPRGVAVDSTGNVYVADTQNHTIRKVTSAGVVTTLAGLAGSFGTADGTERAARFYGPSGVAVDSAGSLYVADTGNHTIRKVTPAGTVTTLAGLGGIPDNVDGTRSAARFSSPTGVAVDSTGNVYVADSVNGTIRKVTPAGVTTLAGLAQTLGNADGTRSDAFFLHPSGVAVDGAGNLYVSDTYSHTLRKVTPTGVVTTLAGVALVPGSADGTGDDVRFNHPYGVSVDGAGNVYVTDSSNNTIRKGYPAFITLSSGPGFGFNVGQFGFNLTGPAGRLVVVEASPDLVSWLPIRTNTFASALNFGDPQRGVYSNRFYRARLP